MALRDQGRSGGNEAEEIALTPAGATERDEHGEGSGLLASLGLILHEAPEGVVAMALALQAGLRPPIAATAAILASSVTTPIGWILAHAIGESGHDVMQAMFAASAGLLLYVGWHLIAGGWRALRTKSQP